MNKTDIYIQALLARGEGSGCVFWPFARNDAGYPVINRKGELTYVHRLICYKVHGEAPEGHETAHSCGNGHLGCVAPWHLSWKTYSDNQMDRIEHGTSNRGDQNGMSVLTEEDVREIKRLLETDTSSTEIAKMYDISKQTVSMIYHGKRWGWVK